MKFKKHKLKKYIITTKKSIIININCHIYINENMGGGKRVEFLNMIVSNIIQNEIYFFSDLKQGERVYN